MNINQIVNTVLLTYWKNRTLPINPFIIAHEMGFQLAVEHNGLGRWEPATRTIHFNPLESYKRQCFSVAHQLGHAILQHQEVPIETHESFSSQHAFGPEYEANLFASSLLMPQGSVQLLLIDMGLTDISVIAQHFGVSEVLCQHRLKQLNYLK